MKFIISLLLTALLSLAAGIWLPWWSIAPAAFLVAALIPQRAGIALLSGFAAIFLLWCGLAWFIDVQNQHLLSARIGQLFHLNAPVLLIPVTGFIGGLVAGMAALTASYIHPRRQPVVVEEPVAMEPIPAE